MFGLEDQKKKKKIEDFVFDLEREFKDSKKNQEYKKKIEERIQKIKGILREGGEKEEFDKFGVLLHGYTSLLIVMGRCIRSK